MPSRDCVWTKNVKLTSGNSEIKVQYFTASAADSGFRSQLINELCYALCLYSPACPLFDFSTLLLDFSRVLKVSFHYNSTWHIPVALYRNINSRGPIVCATIFLYITLNIAVRHVLTSEMWPSTGSS